MNGHTDMPIGRTVHITSIFAAHLRGRTIVPATLAMTAQACHGVMNLPEDETGPELVVRLNTLMMDADEIRYRPGIRWKGHPHHYLVVDDVHALPGVVEEGADAGRITGIATLSGHRIERSGPATGGGTVIELELDDEEIRIPEEPPEPPQDHHSDIIRF